MNQDYSEKIAEIMQMAREKVDSLKKIFKEEKQNMPEKEEFDNNLSKFIEYIKWRKVDQLKIDEEMLNIYADDKKTIEGLIKTSEEDIENSKERIDLIKNSENSSSLPFTLEEEEEELKEDEEELKDLYVRLGESIEKVTFEQMKYDIKKNFDSEVEFISPDDFITKCDECLSELEKDLELKKNMEFKELLTTDSYLWVSRVVDPLKELLAKTVVYASFYWSFKQSKSGCYVATAVYGSYDCPQVWTLRRYRDNELARTWYGRAFIHTYYAISPTIVKYFGDTAWFKNFWRGKLDCMVKDLQSRGFEDTPYNDKDW